MQGCGDCTEETVSKVYIWRFVVYQTVVSICLLVRMQPAHSGCLNDSTLLLARNRSAWSAGPLGPPGSPRCHLWPNRSTRPSQRRDRGSASKASCPHPATWCSTLGEATFPFHSLCVNNSSLWSLSALSPEKRVRDQAHLNTHRYVWIALI